MLITLILLFLILDFMSFSVSSKIFTCYLLINRDLAILWLGNGDLKRNCIDRYADGVEIKTTSRLL